MFGTKKFIISISVFLLCVMNASAKPVVDIKQWQTENGAKVMHVYLPEISMVDIDVIFSAGSARDANNYGLAYLTNQMLNEGTVKQSASEVAESFEKIGAKFSTAISKDQAHVFLRSLTDGKYLSPAIANFTDVIIHPDFPKINFERVKNESLTAIQESKQNPSIVADEAYHQLVYGKHPYAHPSIGNEQSIQQTTIENIRKFYQQYYVAENALIVIVGNLKRDQAERISNQIIAELPKGKKASHQLIIRVQEPNK